MSRRKQYSIATPCRRLTGYCLAQIGQGSRATRRSIFADAQQWQAKKATPLTPRSGRCATFNNARLMDNYPMQEVIATPSQHGANMNPSMPHRWHVELVAIWGVAGSAPLHFACKAEIRALSFAENRFGLF